MQLREDKRKTSLDREGVMRSIVVLLHATAFKVLIFPPQE